jgi:hypothetical protein
LSAYLQEKTEGTRIKDQQIISQSFYFLFLPLLACRVHSSLLKNPIELKEKNPYMLTEGIEIIDLNEWWIYSTSYFLGEIFLK